MSGGHFDYIQSKMEYELVGNMHDPELDALVADLVELINDLDLWLEGDTGEDKWDKAREAFKKKWLRNGHEDRLKELIETEVLKLKNELFKMISQEVYNANQVRVD
jgi:hypothetical protein